MDGERQLYHLRRGGEVQRLSLTPALASEYRQDGWAVRRLPTPKYDLTRLEVTRWWQTP